MSNLIFFDCETTGKAKDFKRPYTDTDNWPRITQLAWAVYTPDEKCLQASSFFIKPDGWVIEAEAQEKTGITLEKCEAEGIPITDALCTFSEDIIRHEAVNFVAHNINFDRNVVGCEYARAGSDPLWMKLKNSTMYCTMLSSTNICKLPGPRGYKWPKLKELHQFLFGTDFVGAHAALNDVQACAKCYFELQRRLTKPISLQSEKDYAGNLAYTEAPEMGVPPSQYRDQLKPYSEHDRHDYTKLEQSWHVYGQSQPGLSTGALLLMYNYGGAIRKAWVPKSQVRIGADDELYVANWKYKELK